MVDYTNRLGYNERYKQRRASGKPGWSDNYKEKGERLLTIIRTHSIVNKGRFLELGCGAGNITLFMAENGFEAYGIDIIPEAINWAKERMKGLSAKADFCVGSVVELKPYTDSFFDLVWDEACLHCVIGPDRAVCLANIFRIVKPGGFFMAGASLVNEGIHERVEISAGRYFDPENRCVMHDGLPFYYLSTEKEFLNEIEQAGFQIRHSEKDLQQSEQDPYKIGNMEVLAVKPDE